MRGLYYVEDPPGTLREISVTVFAETYEHADRTIAHDIVGDWHVSTSWLGIDHQYGSGPPLIYETMVFAGPGYRDDRLQWRYTYRADALRGHARAVAWAMNEQAGAALARPVNRHTKTRPS